MSLDMVCFLCPNSCELKVKVLNREMCVENNECPRGLAFARKEIEDPERILTTTLKVTGGKLPLVSVRTKTPVKKAEMREIMKSIERTKVPAPVKTGQVLLSGVGINQVEIIATRSVEEAVYTSNMQC